MKKSTTFLLSTAYRKTMAEAPPSPAGPGRSALFALWVLAMCLLPAGAYAQLTGIKTIPGDYATIAAAVADLNAQGVGGGGVTFNVAAGHTETSDVPEITASGTAANPIVFQKSGGGANPSITKLTAGSIASSTTLGSHGDGIIILVGSDFITFDGIDVNTNPAFTGNEQMEYGFYLKKASGEDACKNVTIKNCSITLDKAARYSFGVFVSNISGTSSVTVTSTDGRSENIKIFSNTISNVYGGVHLRGFAASAPYDFYDQNNEVGEDGSNTINNYGGGASIPYGVYAIYQNNCKINNNNISGGDGTTTAHYAIYLGTSNNSSYDVENNTISITNNSTTSQVTGIYSNIGTTGNTSNTVNISGNTITNFDRPSATSGTTYFIYSTSNYAFNLNISNNTIGNSNLPGTGAVYGIYQISIPTNYNVTNNTISNITRTATTSTALFYGISSTGSSTGLNTTISGNTIHSLTGFGSSGAVGGINLLTNATSTVFNNKIYNITSDHPSGVVYGISVGSGTITGNIYNNLISGLQAPNTGSSTATSPSVRGINITSTTANSTLDVSYNTVLLEAESVGADFGTAALFATGSATATSAALTLRNNIFVNLSVPNGAGNTVAYQRSNTSISNYSESSNNNLYYAGAPSATNLIFSDGTNNSQTLSDFKAFASPREALSVTEFPPFLSTNGSSPDFLHINPAVPTQVESAGVPIASIATDYDGQTRDANTPDIGADEGNFISVDLSGPSIVYEPIPNSICVSSISLEATINDATGVNTSAGTKPRIWYKKSTESNVLPATNTSADSGWKYVEASNTSSPFIFTIDYSLLTSPIMNGDVIEYFVIAQDISSTPNVGTNVANYPAGYSPTSVALSAAAFPVSNTNSYTILNLPVTITAVASPDAVCISGDVELSLTGDVSTGAEYQWQQSPAGTNTWAPIPGATTADYTVVGVSASTDYRAVVSCGGVPIAASPSSVASVTVSSPMVLSTTPGSACGPGPVTVDLGATASAGATLNWYDVPTGGTSIGSGNTFTTPPIMMTTTYYVAASEGGSTEQAGKPTYVTTTNTIGNGWGLVFDVVNTDININTVDVYSVGATAGTISVDLTDNTGAVLQTAGPFDFPPGSTGSPVTVTLPLNFNVPIGTGYRLLSANASGGALIRETSGNSYPYPSPSGNVVVTSGYIAGPTSATYYWFYNWLVTTGCESAREPVVATVANDPPTCPADMSACINDPAFMLSGGMPAGGSYSGPGVNGGMFDPAVAGVGTHIITYTSCSLTCTFNITVNDLPEVEITSSTADMCIGDMRNLTATPAGGTFEVSGPGTLSAGDVLTATGEGTINITYSYTDAAGCSNSDNASITVLPLTTFYQDSDMDSYGNPNASIQSCLQPAGYVLDNTDCDDTNGDINPGETEICNGIDDNCNMIVDEGSPIFTWYADADMDTYGDPNNSIMACAQPAGYVANDDDCDDTNANINPGAAEVCNGIDDNCNMQVDEGAPAITWYADTDMDTYGDANNTLLSCAQPAGYVANDDDCDDTNSNVNPAATETCNGIDDNCDGQVDESGGASTFYRDFDMDSFGDPNNTISACSQPAGYVANDGDCDDNNSNVNPNATEICNGVDDNCDGMVDNNPSTGPTWYADADMDGFGNPNVSLVACAQPSGYVDNDLDCDDTNTNINPTADEVCNGIDDDCDSEIDEFAVDAITWYQDADGDTYGNQNVVLVQCSQPAGYVANFLDCDDTNANINPNTVWYVDQDGDSYGNPNASVQACDPGTGYVLNGEDCNDDIAAINPGAPEICNGIDDNCNNQTDEGLLLTFYQDSDNDSYGDPNVSLQACSAPFGYVANNTDCDDTNASVFPNATEVCNGVDDNCDGQIDEGVLLTFYQDFDGDGFGNAGAPQQACSAPAGYVSNNTDCDDTNGNAYPGADEVCANGIDDDCDGTVDEGCECNITSIVVSNISACNDNGTGDPFDDTFTADVTVNYLFPPASGTLDLSGDGTASVGVASIGANAYTFTGVTMSADASSIELTASFSFLPSCIETNGNAGVAPGPCSGTCFVEINSVTVTDESCSGNGNGTLTINATASGQEGYSIDGGANFSLTNFFGNLAPGTYDIVVVVFGNPSCTATATATVGTNAAAQTWYKDWDNDGYSDGITQVACAQPAGFKLPANLQGLDNDCDDTDPNQRPSQTWYRDWDNDGYSNGMVLVQCLQPYGYKVAANLAGLDNDCNDNNAAVNPAATEVCNGIDDNCDGQVDEGLADLVFNGNKVFTTQAQVNAWNLCYTVINGNLTIKNQGIVDISRLQNLRMVTGYVLIENTSLDSLAVLHQLDTIGGNLTVKLNSKLETLWGIDSLKSVGGNLQVFNNLKLSDCCAIHDLINSPTGVGGSISIFNNKTGCDNVAEVNTACNPANNIIAPPAGDGLGVEFAQALMPQRIELYPNPAKDEASLTFAKGFTAATVRMFDLQGRLIHSIELEENTLVYQLNLSGVTAGVYLLHVVVDGENFTQRLSVK